MIYTFASSIVRQQKPFWGSQLVESIVDLRCNGSARLSWHFWTGAVAKVAARGRAGGAQASGDGGATKRFAGRTRKPGRTGAADQQRDRAETRRRPKVAGRGRVRSLPRVIGIQSEKAEVPAT